MPLDDAKRWTVPSCLLGSSRKAPCESYSWPASDEASVFTELDVAPGSRSRNRIPGLEKCISAKMGTFRSLLTFRLAIDRRDHLRCGIEVESPLRLREVPVGDALRLFAPRSQSEIPQRETLTARGQHPALGSKGYAIDMIR